MMQWAETNGFQGRFIYFTYTFARSNGRGLYLLKKNAKDVVHRNRKQSRHLSEAIKDKLKDI